MNLQCTNGIINNNIQGSNGNSNNNSNGIINNNRNNLQGSNSTSNNQSSNTRNIAIRDDSRTNLSVLSDNMSINCCQTHGKEEALRTHMSIMSIKCTCTNTNKRIQLKFLLNGWGTIENTFSQFYHIKYHTSSFGGMAYSTFERNKHENKFSCYLKYYNIKRYGIFQYHFMYSMSYTKNKFYSTVCNGTLSSAIYKFFSTIVQIVPVYQTGFHSTICMVSVLIYNYSSTVLCAPRIIFYSIGTVCTKYFSSVVCFIRISSVLPVP